MMGIKGTGLKLMVLTLKYQFSDKITILKSTCEQNLPKDLALVRKSINHR